MRAGSPRFTGLYVRLVTIGCVEYIDYEELREARPQLELNLSPTHIIIGLPLYPSRMIAEAETVKLKQQILNKDNKQRRKCENI